MNCDTCGRLMRRRDEPADGLRPVMQRSGLCRGCYEWRPGGRRTGGAEPGVRRRVPQSEFLSEYSFLQAAGVPDRWMPARLGMSVDAFNRARERAVWRGLL